MMIRFNCGEKEENSTTLWEHNAYVARIKQNFVKKLLEV